MKKLLSFVSENRVLFLFSSLIFLLLRLPSLFEPNWYGDEEIYQVIGRALGAGRTLYSGIWDNKPPILYFLYSFFNSDQFALRLLSLLAGLASLWIFIIFFHLLLHGEKKYQTRLFWGTVLLFAFFLGSPILEGNIANAENFMILPILSAGVFVWQSQFTPIKSGFNKKQSLLVLAGLLLGIAGMIKVVAIFDMLAFFLFLFFQKYRSEQKISSTLSYLSPFLISFLVPFIFFCGYFFIKGNLADFLQAAFLQNIGYVAYSNNLLVPQGMLLIKAILLILAVFIIISQRKKLRDACLFVLLWVSFSLFSVFFSGRPYTHYLLLLLPSMLFLTSAYFFLGKRRKAILGFGLLFIFLILGKNFSFYPQIFGYYQNFFSYITTRETNEAYQSFFDKQIPGDYLAADFLNVHAGAKDTIFVWGNDAQIYTLTDHLPPGKFIVAYHINSSDENRRQEEAVLSSVKPKYIVILPGQENIPYSLSNYHLRVFIGTIAVYSLTKGDIPN